MTKEYNDAEFYLNILKEIYKNYQDLPKNPSDDDFYRLIELAREGVINSWELYRQQEAMEKIADIATPKAFDYSKEELSNRLVNIRSIAESMASNFFVQ